MKQNEIFKCAQWVAPAEGCFQPYIRGEFLAENVQTARITICGLGFFELYINGKRVNEDLFVPVWSDYCAHRTLEKNRLLEVNTSHRIYCVRYDISAYVRQGRNTIGVLLGGGWFEKYDYGSRAKLCYFIEINQKNGEKAYAYSGKKLKWKQSYITSSKIMRGETHDYRLSTENWLADDIDLSGWEDVEIIPAPESDYYIQDCPTDKIIRYIEPKLVKKFVDFSIYDIGENTTGWPIIKIPAIRGKKVKIGYSEELKGTKNLYTDTMGEKHWDIYIGDGKERECHPHFLWQAYRYFSVPNCAKVTKCAVIHADVEVSSSLESSNNIINWLYDAFVRTQLSNIHCSIPSDCPHREGRGYTGDGQLACDAAMLVLDGEQFYKKWLADISDCQDIKTGHVQYTAPYVNSGGGPGGWGCAIVHVPYVYYKNYGDIGVLREFFPKMLRYFEYLEAHSENDLVVSDEPWSWCLGDWCTPEKMAIPEPFVNNYFYIKSLNEAAEIAKIIGREDAIPELRKTAERKIKAITEKYFNPESGNFAGNIQGANAFAVDLGLGNEKTFEGIVKKYSESKMYDTGIFGTDIVTRVLFEKGYAQMAFDLLTSKEKVSFNSIIEQGATTFWEYWDGRHSHNHPMFGAVVRYLFTELLGIKQAQGSTKFDNIIISPAKIIGLDNISGHITTKNGKIFAEINRQGKETEIKIEVPLNAKARLCYEEREIPLKSGKNTFKFGA